MQMKNILMLSALIGAGVLANKIGRAHV